MRSVLRTKNDVSSSPTAGYPRARFFLKYPGMISWLASTLRTPVWLAIALIAGAAGYVLLSRRQLATARRTAVTDELTGLPNRRRIRMFLERQLDAATRGTIALIVFDLDNFKIYNDRHGHPAGDLMLCTFANVLTANLPAGSMAGRYGGEEFLAVLPGCDEAAGVALAERVRRELVRVQAPAKALTVCAGVASGGGGVAGMNELIVAADRALYRAKQNGRDCVCRASEDFAAAS